MNRQDIFNEIQKERAYQTVKWGTSDPQNTEYNWAAYIGAYTNRSLIGFPLSTAERREDFKKDMIKVAALAVAAIEELT